MALTSALRLNLEAILANKTDHSEEFDSLPASLTLRFSASLIRLFRRSLVRTL